MGWEADVSPKLQPAFAGMTKPFTSVTPRGVYRPRMNLRLLLVAPLMILAGSALASERGTVWEIGPEIRGKNYSVGVPSAMTDTHDGPTFIFPANSRGQVKYVTKDAGSLIDARSLTIRYRIEAAPGTRFVANERPSSPAMLSLYFQRRGDNWSARNRYATYRWYSVSDKTLTLAPGEHTMTINFRDDWGAVMGAQSRDNPAFEDALLNADRIGFVFGWSGGRGHGVHATGPARFTLLDFEIR